MRKVTVYEFDKDQVPPDWPREFVPASEHFAAMESELLDLAGEMCEFCRKGVEFAVHPYEPKTLFHNGEDRGFWECQCPEIHAHIANLKVPA